MAEPRDQDAAGWTGCVCSCVGACLHALVCWARSLTLTRVVLTTAQVQSSCRHGSPSDTMEQLFNTAPGSGPGRQPMCGWIFFPCKMRFQMIITIMTSENRGIQIGPVSRGRPRRQEVGWGGEKRGEMMPGQHFSYFWHPPCKWVWICVFHSGWVCWSIFILLFPSHPTFQADSIAAARHCWFLSCDHYGNLASFLLLIYDLVNMPACQMVLFFRLGDNEINKNCCKKQRGGGFFPWMGLSSFIKTCLGGPGPGLTRILSRWKVAKASLELFLSWSIVLCVSFLHLWRHVGSTCQSMELFARRMSPRLPKCTVIVSFLLTTLWTPWSLE